MMVGGVLESETFGVKMFLFAYMSIQLSQVCFRADPSHHLLVVRQVDSEPMGGLKERQTNDYQSPLMNNCTDGKIMNS